MDSFRRTGFPQETQLDPRLHIVASPAVTFKSRRPLLSHSREEPGHRRTFQKKAAAVTAGNRPHGGVEDTSFIQWRPQAELGPRGSRLTGSHCELDRSRQIRSSALLKRVKALPTFLLGEH